MQIKKIDMEHFVRIEENLKKMEEIIKGLRKLPY